MKGGLSKTGGAEAIGFPADSDYTTGAALMETIVIAVAASLATIAAMRIIRNRRNGGR